MGAAILERDDRAVVIARDDHRHFPDTGRAPIAGVGDFVLQAQIVPDRAFEQTLLFARQNVRILIRPERDTRQPGRRQWSTAIRRVNS